MSEKSKLNEKLRGPGHGDLRLFLDGDRGTLRYWVTDTEFAAMDYPSRVIEIYFDAPKSIPGSVEWNAELSYALDDAKSKVLEILKNNMAVANAPMNWSHWDAW